MSYYVPTNLLSTNNAKTIKGLKKNYMTYIMYLAPHTQNSKGINLCSHASEGCVKSCLFSSGTARFEKVQNGKTNKSEYFLSDRANFLLQLDKELTKIKKKHLDSDVIPVIRLNGTSDIRFEKFKVREGKTIFELHSDIQFYDYTKNHLRFNGDLPINYHLTFSLSETNYDKAIELLNKGVNVAMVFKTVPTQYKGFNVTNGDEDDLTFLHPKGTILGLRYKFATGKNGSQKNKEAFESGFIVDVKTTQQRIFNKVSI